MERTERRAQVLRHAKRIFARKGYHRTNVADIISRARIARGTFYLYFQNKKDLFEELLEQVVSELSTRILRLKVGPDETSPVDQLRDNLRRVVSLRASRTRADRHPAQSLGRFRSRARRENSRVLRSHRADDPALARFGNRDEAGAQMRYACGFVLHPRRHQGSRRRSLAHACRAIRRRWCRRSWISDCAESRAPNCSKRSMPRAVQKMKTLTGRTFFIAPN